MRGALTLLLILSLASVSPAVSWAQGGPEPRLLAPEPVAPPPLRVAGHRLTRADGGWRGSPG
jgi:hypothetical protein